MSTLLLPVGAFVGLILTVAGLFPLPSDGAARAGRRRWDRVIGGVALLAAVGVIVWLIGRDQIIQ
ncbi:MAG: hypothetical protein ACREJO_04045 [Phycisphaerales bacterium]